VPELDASPASELVALMRAKEVSSTELLDHQVARIERLHPSLDAEVRGARDIHVVGRRLPRR
jgi:Asp-tRNA(Asn)/Glu-tRNA(Gln) amidotransferase A subunit family amidase